MNKLLNIFDKSFDKKVKFRTIAYLFLLIPIILLWIFSEYQNILFSVTIILLIGSLFFNLQDANTELKETKDEIINKMADLIEFKDSNTGGHVKRVSQYTRLLASLHNELNKEQIELLAKASPLHDIGKISIPDSILNKPEELTKDEWEIMKTHSEKGYEIFKDSKKDYLILAATIAKEHHEKWDGSGYPNQLKEEEISIQARITAIADVFDALSCERPYKKAIEDEKIFKIIEEEKNKHFDPKLVDLFLHNKEKFLSIKKGIYQKGKSL